MNSQQIYELTGGTIVLMICLLAWIAWLIYMYKSEFLEMMGHKYDRAMEVHDSESDKHMEQMPVVRQEDSPL